MADDICIKCDKVLIDGDGRYNFPDGVQCTKCGEKRNYNVLRKPTQEEMESVKPCKECRMPVILYEWKARDGVCVMCLTKQELERDLL